MSKFLTVALLTIFLSGCVTFSFQKDPKTNDFAWKSIGWQGPTGSVTPLVKFGER